MHLTNLIVEIKRSEVCNMIRFVFESSFAKFSKSANFQIERNLIKISLMIILMMRMYSG